MNQINRSKEIDIILKKINAHFPDDIGLALETYISELEDNQKDVHFDDTPVWDVDNPPMWSHTQQKKRAQHRRERAAMIHGLSRTTAQVASDPA